MVRNDFDTRDLVSMMNSLEKSGSFSLHCHWDFRSDFRTIY